MDAHQTIRSIRGRAIGACRRAHFLPPLVARVALGVVFAASGWAKLHDLEKVTQFFTSLGLPAPGFTAGFVGFTELICGFLLLVGLATRLASIPLFVTMVVAIATAKMGNVGTPADLLGLMEFGFIAMLLYLVVEGPGPFSVDVAIAAAIERDGAHEESPDAIVRPLRPSAA